MVTKETALRALDQTFTELENCSVERMIQVVQKNQEDTVLAFLVARILVNHCQDRPWDAGLNDAQRQFMADREWEV